MRDAVRHILEHDWDPHDSTKRPEAAGSYDVYIDPVVALIQSDADEDAVIKFLQDREGETMCFPSLSTRRLQPVARKLLALRTMSESIK